MAPDKAKMEAGMGFLDAVFGMWMGFAAGQGASLPPEMMAPAARVSAVTITQSVGTSVSTEGHRDFAVTHRPWSQDGGLPAWCKVEIMQGNPWMSRATGETIDQKAATMFLLGHEIGHCMDARGFELREEGGIRRENFGDAFATCLMVKAGRLADVELIGAARESEFPGRRGAKHRKTIERAKKRPECQGSRGHEADFLEAWTVAAELDVALFGADGATPGPDGKIATP